MSLPHADQIIKKNWKTELCLNHSSYSDSETSLQFIGTFLYGLVISEPIVKQEELEKNQRGEYCQVFSSLLSNVVL